MGLALIILGVALICYYLVVINNNICEIGKSIIEQLKKRK